MAVRPRHPRRDLEELLREAENRGWRVHRGKRYFKCYCPCPEEHFKTVRLSPSDPKYELNLRKWLERQSCWAGEAEAR